jgi:hypothetical protein
VVDHSDDVPCTGKFLLHQGLQRRIAITLCHESTSDLIWKDVKEVVIGKPLLHWPNPNVFERLLNPANLILFKRFLKAT